MDQFEQNQNKYYKIVYVLEFSVRYFQKEGTFTRASLYYIDIQSSRIVIVNIKQFINNKSEIRIQIMCYILGNSNIFAEFRNNVHGIIHMRVAYTIL